MNKKLTSLLFLFLLSCNVDSSTEFGIGSPEPFYGDMSEGMSMSRSESLSQGDYIVKTAYGSVDVSSGSFNQKVNEFKTLIDKYEGYITNTYLSTNYQGLRSYNLTSSIPAESFDEFLIEVEKVSKFSNININANDVTTYVLNIDSRLNSLLNEKADLEEIKAEAKTTSEKLEVQSQLRYINQDIEILEDQNSTRDRLWLRLDRVQPLRRQTHSNPGAERTLFAYLQAGGRCLAYRIRSSRRSSSLRYRQ